MSGCLDGVGGKLIQRRDSTAAADSRRGAFQDLLPNGTLHSTGGSVGINFAFPFPRKVHCSLVKTVTATVNCCD